MSHQHRNRRRDHGNDLMKRGPTTEPVVNHSTLWLTAHFAHHSTGAEVAGQPPTVCLVLYQRGEDSWTDVKEGLCEKRC